MVFSMAICGGTTRYFTSELEFIVYPRQTGKNMKPHLRNWESFTYFACLPYIRTSILSLLQ